MEPAGESVPGVVGASPAGDDLVSAARDLAAATADGQFGPPTAYVYRPLEYAWAGHAAYLRRAGAAPKRVVFLGMNPGPWGMTQTGVPFGEIALVRDWMGIEARIGHPDPEHPKRPVEGFACQRSEVSGRRLWGLFRERFGEAANFFREHLVLNYCPLVFLEESGRNRTPEQLPAAERQPLEEACDAHLRRVLALLQPEWFVGVGGFAEKRLQRIGCPPERTLRILHPSPASPAANRDWAGAVTRTLLEAGVWED
jgi:single-strand selective monofunctional uracil DNA glycosylase